MEKSLTAIINTFSQTAHGLVSYHVVANPQFGVLT